MKESRKPGLASPAEPWAPSDKARAGSLCADGHSGQECKEWPGRVQRAPDAVCPPGGQMGLGCGGGGFSQGPSASILPSAAQNQGAHWRPPIFSTCRCRLRCHPSGGNPQSRAPDKCLVLSTSPPPPLYRKALTSLYIPTTSHCTSGPSPPSPAAPHCPDGILPRFPLKPTHLLISSSHSESGQKVPYLWHSRRVSPLGPCFSNLLIDLREAT